MSWESTIPYYRIINETVKQRMGGLHSARIVLYSVEFHEIERMQHAGDWAAAAEVLIQAARSLRAAGAECLVICTNTMHKVATEIESAAGLPLLHIADPTAREISACGINNIGLLGTRFTMEQEFYRGRLLEKHGISVTVPEASDREIVHRVIYDELCLGKVYESSRTEFRRVMAHMIAQGAQGIILGCTEIAMLVTQSDSSVPIFDTTSIHARSAAEWALDDDAGTVWK
jgi:aspartate racemase